MQKVRRQVFLALDNSATVPPWQRTRRPRSHALFAGFDAWTVRYVPPPDPAARLSAAEREAVRAVFAEQVEGWGFCVIKFATQKKSS